MRTSPPPWRPCRLWRSSLSPCPSPSWTWRCRRRRRPYRVSLRPSRAGDRAAVGVIDGHHKVRPALHLRGARKSFGREKRGSRHAVAARDRVQCLAIGDDNWRAAGGGPTHGRSADRLRLRERGGAYPRRCGRALRERRRRHAGRRRGVSCSVVLLANGLVNGLSLWLKRVTSDEHPDRKRRPSPASVRRGNARPFVPATQSLIGFHPRPRNCTMKAACADRVKGRFKMNRRLTIMSKFARQPRPSRLAGR